MDAGDRRPLLDGRGLLPIDDFCRSTGLDRSSVEGLVVEGKLEGATHQDGRVAALLDDVLPTAEQLRAWGLAVSDDYDPGRLYTHEVEADESDDAERYSARPDWSMPSDDVND